MLWEIEIRPAAGQTDREAERVLADARDFGLASVNRINTARSFLLEGDLSDADVQRAASELLADPVVETWTIRQIDGQPVSAHSESVLNVLLKPGVTDNVARTAAAALADLQLSIDAVATCRRYTLNDDATPSDRDRLAAKLLSNDAIERFIWGPLQLDGLAIDSDYRFELKTVAIREMDDDALIHLSKHGQLYLSLTEMQTIRDHFISIDRDPTDIELETVAQTWSEHCSHKTLAGRIRYRDENGEKSFNNMLKETIFEATQTIRKRLGNDDWCVSVFEDNAGIVKFNDEENVCFKVETHNHPSALEPYGGANTGLGGVIRDPLGTGLGARPVCNTDVFCFAPPDTPSESLPPGVLHPKVVMQGVVAGVRDYGNRMGIPTVNGAVYFDDRYLGNPLVYCGNVAMIPVDKCEKRLQPGDYIVAVGGRTGRDGIHGATFSSAELTEESETLSGGAVQIGNPVVEKMVMDVILAARDRNLYSSITDCGAGGFSSAVGEMGEKTGAEVWLEKAPLKYAGLSYTEIWISEAQERMVLAVPPENWDELHALCESEGVEATIIGKFTETERLILKYHDTQVADLTMEFLHDGRPPVVRDAIYEAPKTSDWQNTVSVESNDWTGYLHQILGSLNVCSKEWIIRQYDHEVLAGSVVKPLVGVQNDGPSDAAVVRPLMTSNRGLVIACGMNPCFGDADPYWMAAAAIDEAIRNCIVAGADPNQIAILDNFCWGNTERAETLGSLVRAALACHDFAVAYGTPFISGKDSLNNEFSFQDETGNKQTVAIPSSLLISALGQMEDVHQAVTMDLKAAGNALYLLGETKPELGGSHFALVSEQTGGAVPKLDAELATRIYNGYYQANRNGLVRSGHDLSEGGLAVALAEMAFAGGLGVEADLSELSQQTGLADSVELLFSESNSRLLVEVPADRETDFQSHFQGLPCVRVGSVTESDRVVVRAGQGSDHVLIDGTLAALKQSWKQPLAWN
ncbi:phosphoribosylformylglycinamidine synthase subunit PurL [Thalassoroseus pseudoceratinae]|uniref:phosphoribosylformylglycinamidine synthase subunit PurL n=1 Tax=Thalassoroseus pseudoceratinae TaxID=2713176 RepID=UPI00141F4736|nr:phosphoribosylformylglycinamidine synthase subunit PurL [Thalassoroseus pseudoceratinae]